MNSKALRYHYTFTVYFTFTIWIPMVKVYNGTLNGVLVLPG